MQESNVDGSANLEESWNLAGTSRLTLHPGLMGKRETHVHKTESLITGQGYTLKYSGYGYRLLVRI